MSGGLTYSPTDGFGWSWEGAAQGFAMGTLIGMVSGGMSSYLSGVGSSALMTKVAQSTYTTKQVLLNMVLNGTLSTLKETTSEKFDIFPILTSMIFSNIGTTISSIKDFVKFGKNIINIVLQFGEEILDYIFEYKII